MPNANYSCFRWLEQLVVPLMVLGSQAVVDRSSCHCHRSIWRNAQIELLRQIVQGQQLQQQQRDGHNAHQPQAVSYLDFLGTQPPLFNVTEEPLDADA